MDTTDVGLHKDGLHVYLFRDSDQRLLVCIESHDLAEHGPDVHPGGDCIPRIRVRVNESLQEIGPDGEWVTL